MNQSGTAAVFNGQIDRDTHGCALYGRGAQL